MNNFSIRLLVILGLFFALLISSGCDSLSNEHQMQKVNERQAAEQAESPAGSPKVRVINAGMDAQFKKQSMVAASESDFDEMLNDASNNNAVAWERMINKGTLWIADQGTKVHVLSKSSSRGDKIEFLTGPQKGKIGYAISDSLE